MKEDISKQFFSPEQMAAALDAAPERVIDPDTPYDPNDETAVNAFWEGAEVRMPGQRGKQKAPTKERITIRLSPEVVEYFREAGEGWQSKLDEALKTYVKQQGEPLEETIRRVIREEVQSAMVKHAA